MLDFLITTDSTCDLPDSYLAQHQIDTFSLNYRIDDITYGDDMSLELKEFYSLMRSGKTPTTNACNPEVLKEHFQTYVREGKRVLHIAFSSGLSASYNAACIAADDVKEEYPDAQIIVIDSLCASLGEGLLVHKAVMMRESGKSFEETAAWVEDNKRCICHEFTVEDLHYLQRGGRVSKTTAIIGSMINVKPILHVDDEGHLISLCNVRGRKKSLITLVEHMKNNLKDSDIQNDIVFISHGDSLEDAEYVASLVKEHFGIDQFLFSCISPTIGSHSGPGTIALFYVGTQR